MVRTRRGVRLRLATAEALGDDFSLASRGRYLLMQIN